MTMEQTQQSSRQQGARRPQQPSQLARPLPQQTASSNSMSSTTTTTTLADLQDAIVRLNNAAVTLLVKGNCGCTIHIFKSALGLLKTTADTTKLSDLVRHAEERVRQVEAEQAEGTAGSCGGGEDTTTTTTTTNTNNNNNNVVVFDHTHDAAEAYNHLSVVRTSKACLKFVQDDHLKLDVVKAVLVYNYGVAHRCCKATNGQNPNGLQSFCLQIFQYAEKLTPESCDNLLFRMLLTRNLMMLSCKLGMRMCEFYKATLDPIVEEILGTPELPPESNENACPAA